MEKKIQDYLLKLATGSKEIEAVNFSRFDNAHVIRSDDFAYRMNEKGEVIYAHFQLRIVHSEEIITLLELEYVPLKAGEKYYELEMQNLRSPRTIYNLPLVMQELNNLGYKWSYDERYYN